MKLQTKNHSGGMMKRAVLYARVSGDDRKYATSGIDSQLADCRKYADEKDYQIVGEYYEERDKQTSGASWLPELEAILKLAHKGGFDVLVVRELDRLARNKFKQLSIEVDLQVLGIAVEYVIGQYDDSAEGRLLKGLMSEFAEYEREKIRDRTANGIIRSVDAGNVKTGGCYAPYGYDRKKVNGRRTLVINDYEASVVRLIFNLYVRERKSLHQIATFLDAQEIPKPLKGAAHKANADKTRNLGWSIGTISGILENEVYIGRWYYGKSKSIKNPKTGKRKHVKKPKSEWKLVEVQAIISEEIFAAVKLRKKENKRQLGKRRRYFYALGGMLTCGYCGNSVSGFSSRKGSEVWSYYRCNARAQKTRYAIDCELPYFKVDDVEKTIWFWVKSILLDPGKLAKAFNDYQNGITESYQPAIHMIETNRKRLDQLQEEKTRLKDAYKAGILDLEEFAQDRTQIDKEISNLVEALEQLQEEIRPQMLTQVDMENIEAFAAVVRDGADIVDNDRETQRDLFQKLGLQATLIYENDQHLVDVSCMLGQFRSDTNYETSWCTGYSNGPGPELALHGCPSQTHHHFR